MYYNHFQLCNLREHIYAEVHCTYFIHSISTYTLVTAQMHNFTQLFFENIQLSYRHYKYLI